MKTCPGSTPTCRRNCYATTHRFRFPSVQARLAGNLEAARDPDFWKAMVGLIRADDVRTLRIHAAGDFFSPEYVEQWVKIAKRCPDTTMWAYTRSWRRGKFRKALRKLAKLPNVVLYWSCDIDTGLPVNAPAGVRTAWLMTTPTEVPPESVDLVFRTRSLRSIVAKKIKTAPTPSPVCPTETGLPKAHDVHCSTCRKCFTPDNAVAGRISLAMAG